MDTVTDPNEPVPAVADNPDNLGLPESMAVAIRPLLQLADLDDILTNFTVQHHPGTPPDDDPTLIASILLEATLDLPNDDRDVSASILFTLTEENGDLIATAEATWERDGDIETFGPYVATWDDPWEWIVEHLDVASV